MGLFSSISRYSVPPRPVPTLHLTPPAEPGPGAFVLTVRSVKVVAVLDPAELLGVTCTKASASATPTEAAKMLRKLAADVDRLRPPSPDA
jgi:hypothetical protein